MRKFEKEKKITDSQYQNYLFNFSMFLSMIEEAKEQYTRAHSGVTL